MATNANEKKSNFKLIVVGLSFIALVILLIHLSQIWFADEHIITYSKISIDGNNLTVIFTEKTNTINDNSQHQKNIETNNNHLGYCLELYDSTANKSYDKVKFDSPVRAIQNKPQLFVFSSGIVWIISTSNDIVSDKPGFILKFEIKNKKIIKSNFTLDEEYKIRNISGYKVILTKGNTPTGMNFDTMFGCTYFDLEQEKIIELSPAKLFNSNGK
ncbi:MAG: hypothetical protein SFY56_11090 [Bacteroidota bacterium]|nr:hypothetical protein [Bacteroidota bacterium]